MPLYIETTARIAVVRRYYDGSEVYRAPVTILEETTRTGAVRFEAVRPPLGGGGYVALTDLHQGTGYSVEVIELTPVPEAGQEPSASIERTPDGIAHLTAHSPFFPRDFDEETTR